MCAKESVDLGLSGIRLPVGTHICQIYNDEVERNDSLLRFVQSGLQGRERVACFTEKVPEAKIREYVEASGLAFDEMRSSGAFQIKRTSEVYFKDGKFDMDRMLAILTAFHEDSVASGHSCARVIGEMDSAISRIPGGDHLMEYESRVTMLLRQHPVTAVCQYNANDFDGGTILDVLKVHPMMIIRGAIVHNPFFIEPEQYLSHAY